jgi:hypothetical protein
MGFAEQGQGQGAMTIRFLMVTLRNENDSKIALMIASMLSSYALLLPR